MRYDDPRHVETWQELGVYPAIHRPMVDVALNDLELSAPVLDLCSSTGLLGHRLRGLAGMPVCALEGDRAVVDRSTLAGIYSATELPCLQIKLNAGNMPSSLRAWLLEHNVKSVLARRCLMELSKVLSLAELAKVMHRAGVETIVLEGHRPGRDRMLPADAQAEPFLGPYRLTRKAGDVRTLRVVRNAYPGHRP